jgi:hypothetical protein
MRGGLSPREFDLEMELVQESLAELPGSQWMEYLRAFQLKPVGPVDDGEDID